jgi:hypothetical protein
VGCGDSCALIGHTRRVGVGVTVLEMSHSHVLSSTKPTPGYYIQSLTQLLSRSSNQPSEQLTKQHGISDRSMKITSTLKTASRPELTKLILCLVTQSSQRHRRHRRWTKQPECVGPLGVSATFAYQRHPLTSEILIKFKGQSSVSHRTEVS